jgi:hypothetical protein
VRISVGTLQTRYLTYMLQAKTKGKVCVHTLPRATAVLKPTSLLREGSGAAICLRLRIPPAIQEGSGADTCPSALDPTSPLRRDPTLTRVLWLRTVPASEVGSNADTCPMAIHRSWPIEIK